MYVSDGFYAHRPMQLMQVSNKAQTLKIVSPNLSAHFVCAGEKSWKLQSLLNN